MSGATADQVRNIQARVLRLHGWRIDAHTARYIAERLSAPAGRTAAGRGGAPRAFPILAADARTGLPVHPVLDPTTLSEQGAGLFD